MLEDRGVVKQIFHDMACVVFSLSQVNGQASIEEWQHDSAVDQEDQLKLVGGRGV
jgi:phosphoribosylformimino-5-aminoimidazole carboxamide ribonucleotide (ProFAR) isomerase